MIVEIVTIGTELLLGEIVDTNSAHIAQELTAIGVDHYFSTTVGDNLDRIVAALRLALSRSDVVITTGGLGPTVDDVTREAVAAVSGRQLEFQPRLLEQIEGFFQRRGTAMSPNNRRQAYVPAGATVIENPVGTAPAFAVEFDQKAIVSLPGVPHEMVYLLREAVLPYLSKRMGEPAVILVRQVHTVCIGESLVDQEITDLMRNRNPSVGTRAHPGQTDVCITAKAPTREAAAAMLDKMETQVRSRLGKVIYGVDGQTLAGVVVGGLRQAGMRLAVAEAETHGLVARKLFEADPDRAVLAGVLHALDSVSLSDEAGVSGAGSGEERARQVAALVRSRYGADLGLAVLEGGETPPLAYVALLTPGGELVRRWPSRGQSENGILWTVHYALDAVRLWLLDRPTTAVLRQN